MTVVSYRWRPPRKNNDAAWKRVAAGDWLWEHPKPKASDQRVYWNGREWVEWKRDKQWIVINNV